MLPGAAGALRNDEDAPPTRAPRCGPHGTGRARGGRNLLATNEILQSQAPPKAAKRKPCSWSCQGVGELRLVLAPAEGDAARHHDYD